MSVVGIDFGNQSCYVAVARQGGLETITNDYSLRATPSCIAFGSKTRQVGVAGRQQLLTNIKNAVISFKHLIGRRFDDPVVQEERKWLAYELIELPEKKLGIKVNHLGETRVFTPEQILAILLAKLRTDTESYLKTKVTDCVIAVPSYWTDAQRRALLDSTKIAELNCLRLMNETTAVALNYGIYKELPDENEKPRRVVFLDIGYSSTQASLVAFNKGKLKMLNVSWDLNLGGRDFDAVLRDHFADEFKQKFKVDARANARAWIRLLDECEKMKKQMSANSNPIPISIECFLNDKDVNGVMKRSDFENLCAPLWQRLEKVLQRLMAETKINIGDVDVVELVGGGTRMPMVRNVVQNVLGKDPQTTLNQDEAVCRGCALQCAMLSPTFRVREFSVTDLQPYSIKLTWSSKGDDGGDMEVFPERHQFPFSKILTFYRKEPFALEAVYSLPNHVPYPTTKIGRFSINNIAPGTDGDSSKVKVKVRLNADGIFKVLSASMYESKQTTEDEQTEAMDTDAGAADTTAGENAANGPNGDGATTDNQEQTDKMTDGGRSSSPGQQTQHQEKETKGQKSQKAKVKCVDLPIASQVPEMTENELAKFRSIERDLHNSDLMEREKADSKNALEEYVYEMKNKLSDQYRQFVSPADAAQLADQLERVEQWLYEDGDDQPKQVYVDKLQEFKRWGDPIVERYQEAQERPVAFEEFGRSLQMARKAYEMYCSKDLKYDHIEAPEMEKVRKAIEEKQAWFDQNQNAQARRSLTDPPAVFGTQIRAEKDAFERIVLPVLNKPKPKKEAPPPPPAANPADQQANPQSQEQMDVGE